MNVEILKKEYQKYLKLGITISLLMHLFLFHSSKRFTEPVIKKPVDEFKFDTVEFAPATKQKQKPAPLPPTIPIAGEKESLPELDPDIFFPPDINEIKPPPPPAPSLFNQFIKVEEPAEPIGGYSAVLKHLTYPEVARKAEIEGQVKIAVLIDKFGNVIDTKIEKSLPGGCDDAAIAAIKSVKWKPAMQRDEPVQVVMHIPIHFKLAN